MAIYGSVQVDNGWALRSSQTKEVYMCAITAVQNICFHLNPSPG